MPHPGRKRCVVCGGHVDEVGPISWSGKCEACWPAILAENVLGIANKSGPAHKRRLRGIVKYVERELLDVQRVNP